MSEPYRIVRHRERWSLAYSDDAGKRLRIALGTDDRGVAEARARKLWAERSAPATERVADLWIGYLADRQLDIADTSRLAHAWKALAPHFGHKLGSALSSKDCRDYHAARTREGRAASTVRTELEYLRACINRRYGKGVVKLWTPPASAPRDRFLTREELDKLLGAISTPHVRLFVILAITTGARMSAILELTWDRVQVERTPATVDYAPAGRHQTNKRRVLVPLNARAVEALKEARRGAETEAVIEFAGGPVASVKKSIAAAARRSGVPCSPHVFRHTAGVWMAQADVPMQKIAQFLGHTSAKVTERVYARYSPSFMQDASAALDF